MFCNELVLKILFILYYISSVAYRKVLSNAASVMEGNIVGGEFSDITKFPHAAAMVISCVENNVRESSLCGGSIINQNVLISAAHCFESCSKMTPNSEETMIYITVGSTSRLLITHMANDFIIHESYDTKTVTNDIALISVDKPFTLGDTVKRVIVPTKPVKTKSGFVAGWGVTNEITLDVSNDLKSLEQNILGWNECQKLLITPPGTICGHIPGKIDHADRGDSGSGLMVQSIIAVGLVSYKDPSSINSITVYTDVYYFRNWIRKAMYKLLCSPNNQKKTKKKSN